MDSFSEKADSGTTDAAPSNAIRNVLHVPIVCPPDGCALQPGPAAGLGGRLRSQAADREQGANAACPVRLWIGKKAVQPVREPSCRA